MFKFQNSAVSRPLTGGLLGVFAIGLLCGSIAKADLNEGFIHGYWFDNSFSDVMGTASGTACNNISITENGFIGQAVSCDSATKTYLRLEDSHNTAFGIEAGKNGKITLLCWFNPAIDSSGDRVLISNSNWKSGKNAGVVLNSQYKGGPYYNIGDGSDRIDINGNIPVVTGEWQFVAATTDLTTNEAYLYYGTTDGTLQQVGSTNTSSIDSLLSTYKWYIGVDYNGYYYSGLIDEMGVWNRALSFDEINQIYTAQQNGTSLGNQLALASSAATAQAGAYTDAATWAGGIVPKADANVTINSAVTSDGRTFNGEAVIGEDGSLSAAGCVFVGHSYGTDAKLTINGGDNAFTGNSTNGFSSSLIIGFQGGNGEFVLNDGTVTTSGYTYVSYNAGGEAKFTQNGGTYNAGNNIAVAYNANEVATMLITGGEMNVNGSIRIGIGANSTGQVTVSGGNVTAKVLQIGRASAGDSAKMTITGGVVEVTDAIYGSSSKASGNLYISGTGQLVLNSSNTGNAIRELTSFKIEGSGADGTGALLFKKSLKSAAAITLTNNATIGIEPGATFTQTAAIAETQSSSLTVTGGGTLALTNGGGSFTGNVYLNDGIIKMSGKGSSSNTPIGKLLASRYVYVNSGTELVFANQDVLANAHSYAPINFVVDGGKISNEGANYNFLQNTTLKNGGQLYASDGNATWKAFKLLNVTVARNDDGAAGAPVLFSSAPNNPNATIAFGDISDIVEAGTSVATINVAEITSADALVNDNVSDLVISAVIEDPVYKTDGGLKNAGEIKKTGAGTMEFTASNTYTGKTSVTEGTLRLTDDAVAAHGPIVVGDDGTLELNVSDGQTKKTTVDADNKITSSGQMVKTGAGTLQIDTAAAGQVNASSFVVSSGRLDMKEYFTGAMEVESGATLSPGNSVGTLTIDGSYNQDPNGTLLLEVGKDELGDIVIDQLIVNGNAAFESGSIINISLDPSSSLVGGDTFSDVTVLTADNAANIFDDVVSALQSYYFTDLTPTLLGNQILLSGRLDANAVPEPSTWALLALGVAGLMYWRKRKN
ncbi:MAG: autotransporter-associated beta strand repeat-containing protein [Thermoguttaceae bacterium]|nr:autotransporter-associated beta strand repeat-containing protein [Thermoguttaceae bacterium]